MTGGLLVLWPRDSREPLGTAIERATRAASERAPITILIAGGDEPASVSDARLDSRDSLSASLGWPRTATDEDLLDAAYDRWGSELGDHVAGDFTFARWEPARGELMLMRDHLGMRPLYHARYSGGFAAATDLRSLRVLPGVDLDIEPLFVAMCLTDIFVSDAHTIHRGIRRLPAGHLMVVKEHGAAAQQRRYWHPSREELVLPSEGDYLERFRATFMDAVRDRIPADGLVATELSGGLDSTVVTAAVAEVSAPNSILALAASFAHPRFDGGIHDEGSHRSWARNDPRIELMEADGGSLVTADAIDRLIDVGGIPAAQIMDLVRLQLWRLAKERGASVVLDGFDGDTTINYGFERWMSMLRGAHLTTLVKELRASYRTAGRRGLREAGVLVAYPTFHRIRRRFRRPAMVSRSVASERLLRESGLLERLDALELPAPGDVRGDNILDVTSGDTAMSIERCEIAATAAGIEVRHPFFDLRLVELAISLPADLLFRNRMPRWIERRALEGLGPHDVLWRHDKGRMPDGLIRDALERMPLGQQDARPSDVFSVWIEAERLRIAVERWDSQADLRAAYSAYPAAVLETWVARFNPDR
jgi:asparagine synthase (glutamine-hydrolysing)